MDVNPLIRFLIAGQLHRDFIVTADGNAFSDQPGGSLFYAAGGFSVWESGAGLLGRVDEDYPRQWIEHLKTLGFDCAGISFVPEKMDLRAFTAYPDLDTCQHDNPISHYSRLGLPFPKQLLGYSPPNKQIDSRIHLSASSIRQAEIPAHYMDALAVHIGPMDYYTHSSLPSVFRQGNSATITLDPGAGYMHPVFWDDIPGIVKNVSAFLISEDKARSLFLGRSTDPWEMTETLAAFGCDIVVMKRGALGQYLFDAASHRRWVIPAYPARVKDPTGAGDAFCGGFLAGYRLTFDPLDGVLHGNVSASLSLEGSGPFFAAGALPGLAQARLDSLRAMAHLA